VVDDGALLVAELLGAAPLRLCSAGPALGAWVAAEVVPLRVGFERDSETGTDRVTGGVGVEGDRGALDYGARFWVGAGRPDEGFASWHGISLRLFF
jgi:hypothetical protein